jgi:hypothetical protein
MLPIVFWADRAARLTVAPDGVELRQAGATLQTTWSNIAALRDTPGGEGFVLHEPMSGRGAERFALTAGVRVRGAALYDDARLQLIAARRFIPIEAFAYWLRRGDLRAVLKEWAPHLAADGAATTAGAAEPAPRAGKRPVWLAVVLVLLVGGAIAVAFLPAGTQAGVVRFLLGPVALVFVLMAVRNLTAAVRLLRSRHLWFALLWIALAAVQILVALLLTAQLIGPTSP